MAVEPYRKIRYNVWSSPAYVQDDYSLTRDTIGNEYWVRTWRPDQILRKDKAGNVTVLAEGAFKEVQWMLALNNRLYFINKGGIYFTENGKVFLLQINP